MSQVIYHLRDRNAALVAEWERRFSGTSNVEISHGDIFEARADAVVSPANSFGYMDGGIDAVYLGRFGDDLQVRLQAIICSEFAGELPVGQAVVVPTGDAHMPFMVSAPTMRIPMDVSDTVNAYLAFRAAILAVASHNHEGGAPIRTVLCPGLGTAIGKLPFAAAAEQMLLAYRVAAEGRTDYHDRGMKVLYNHRAMLGGGPIRSA